MPRFLYWTILIGNEPTAFRARERDDIVPTLKQLQRKHPDAVLRWFERGRLWDSPAQARAELDEARRRRAEARPSGWRPGGEHRDPRARFKKPREQKKREILRRLHRASERGERPAEASGRGRNARQPEDHGSGSPQQHGDFTRDWRRPEAKHRTSGGASPDPERVPSSGARRRMSSGGSPSNRSSLPAPGGRSKNARGRGAKPPGRGPGGRG